MTERQMKKLQTQYYIEKYYQLSQHAANQSEKAYYEYMLEKELKQSKIG